MSVLLDSHEVVYFPLVYFPDDFRLNFEMPIRVHKSVNFLLDIGSLGVAVSRNTIYLFNSCGYRIKPFDKFLFRVYLAAVTPALFRIVKGNAAVFADDYRLVKVRIT